VSRSEIKVGLLGLGVVGSGTVRILSENAGLIARKVGVPVTVARAAVRDLTKVRDIDLPPNLITTDPYTVINDPDIDIIVEVVGGIEPARSWLLQALNNGKHVVTANKELMARFGGELLRLAEDKGLDFSFEASVGGGIPIIQPLKQALSGNRFSSIYGIVNGTTNYILSKMTSEGADFADVLAEAQAQGFAEADPTNDVDGYDARFKTAILSSIAFNSRVNVDDIPVEGIRSVSKRDIEVAGELGYVIKLLGIGQETSNGLQVRVHPALLARSHPLASVDGVYNAVYVRGEYVGDVMLYGRGAGSLPTGSAIVGDIIETGRNIMRGATGRLGCTCFETKPQIGLDDLVSRYYLRIETSDRPRVLTSVTGILGDFDVSIGSMVQHERPDNVAEMVLITHPSLEVNMRSALDVLGRITIVKNIASCLRVVE
jgi:homoserine dehydrogenase